MYFIEAVKHEKRSSIGIQKKARSSNAFKQIRRGWRLYVLFLLPLLYIIVFKYVPMYGAQISFKNFIVTKGIWDSEWIGFTYFERFFNSYQFWRVLKNTLILSVYSLAAGFPFPIILALSLNHVGSKYFKSWVQMITYAPNFISMVVMVGLIFQFLGPRRGIVNSIMQFLGIGPINFMGKPELFTHIYVWTGIWQSTGFGCIVFLAALSGIDPHLHEAATVDGASKLRRMWHIDLPGIMPIAIILLILNAGSILDTGFEKVLLMQNPLNLRSSEVIDTYVYKVGLLSQTLDFSYATAIGLFKSIVGLILLVTVNKIARKTGQESLW